jgi:hypothetical protein
LFKVRKNAFAITSDNENKPDLTKKTAEYINIFIYFAAVSFFGGRMLTNQ